MVAVVIIASMIGVAGIAAMSVQSNIASAGTDRAKIVALYAAESGAIAAMSTLHGTYVQSTKWQSWFDSATREQNTLLIPSNQAPACTSAVGSNCNAYFEIDQQARYEVEVFNNSTDPGAVWDATEQAFLGTDTDGRVVIRSTGYGPNGTTARIEWEVGNPNGGINTTDCPTYAQRGMSETGSGSNRCMGNVDLNASVATFTP